MLIPHFTATLLCHSPVVPSVLGCSAESNQVKPGQHMCVEKPQNCYHTVNIVFKVNNEHWNSGAWKRSPKVLRHKFKAEQLQSPKNCAPCPLINKKKVM